MPRPRLTFACELSSERLDDLFADRPVIAGLRALNSRVALPLTAFTPECAGVVHRLNDRASRSWPSRCCPLMRVTTSRPTTSFGRQSATSSGRRGRRSSVWPGTLSVLTPSPIFASSSRSRATRGASCRCCCLVSTGGIARGGRRWPTPGWNLHRSNFSSYLDGSGAGFSTGATGWSKLRLSATSVSCPIPTGGDPSITPMIPRMRFVTATRMSTGLAVAQKVVQTSGTALTGFSTLTGKPSLSKITNECPAPIASAFAAACPGQLVIVAAPAHEPRSRGLAERQPNRKCRLTPASASCRSSTVLMKCA